MKSFCAVWRWICHLFYAPRFLVQITSIWNISSTFWCLHPWTLSLWSVGLPCGVGFISGVGGWSIRISVQLLLLDCSFFLTNNLRGDQWQSILSDIVIFLSKTKSRNIVVAVMFRWLTVGPFCPYRSLKEKQSNLPELKLAAERSEEKASSLKVSWRWFWWHISLQTRALVVDRKVTVWSARSAWNRDGWQSAKEEGLHWGLLTQKSWILLEIQTLLH